MRKALSNLLLAVAGFFFYTLCVLAFVTDQLIGAKLLSLVLFLIPALACLAAGLGLSGFRNWMRDTGIVFLGAAGFTAFLVLTFACLLMSDQLRKMMRPETLKLFGDYFSGGGFIVGLAVLGSLLLLANKRRVDHAAAPTRESATPRPHE